MSADPLSGLAAQIAADLSFLPRAFHLVAIHPERGGKLRAKWFGDDRAAAEAWANAQNRQGFNVYYTANVVREGLNRKPRKADIVAVRHFWVEIDPPIDEEKVRQALSLLPPTATMIWSGNGFHLLWRVEGASTDACEEVNRRLVHVFGGDKSCTNVDRLLRVPGTINYPTAAKLKAGRTECLALLLEHRDDVSCSVAALLEALPAPPHESRESRNTSDVVLGPYEPTPIAELKRQPSPGLLRLLSTEPAGDRSAACIAAAKWMLHEGYSREEVPGVMYCEDNPIAAHVFDQPDKQRAAERIAAQAEGPPKPEDVFAPAWPVHLPDGASPVPLETVPREITATSYVRCDPSAIPPRDWLYGRALIRGFVSLLVAPGGVGKSALTIGEALALASGQPLLGAHVKAHQRVWLWNLEDPEDELQRRIEATCQHYELNLLSGRLFVDSGRSNPLCTAEMTRDGVSVLAPVREALIAELRRHHIDVLIVDPFVSSHRVPENDNAAMDSVAKAWNVVASKAQCAVLLVHHTKKLGGGQADEEAARGASALVAAARSARVLNRMTDGEAGKLGVGLDERRFFFRAENAKHNLSPPEKAEWYKLQSVRLANGDDVGVVARWQPPSPKEWFTEEHLNELQSRLAGNPARAHYSAKGWVGYPLAEIAGVDLSDLSGKRMIQEQIKTWIAQGSLRAFNAPGPDRKPVPMVGPPG